MNKNTSKTSLPAPQILVFGILLYLLVPAVLVLEKFRLFLAVVFLQLAILILVFYQPVLAISLHLFLFFILIINSLRKI